MNPPELRVLFSTLIVVIVSCRGHIAHLEDAFEDVEL